MAANRGQSEPEPIPGAGGGKEDQGGAPPPPRSRIPSPRHPLPLPPLPPPSPEYVPEPPVSLTRVPPRPSGRGRQRQDHGGASDPPPPQPPSLGHTLPPSAPPPQLPAPPPSSPHLAAIKSGRRTSLKALGLVRKTLTQPLQKRILPDHHGITIATKKKESKEQHAEIMKPWRTTSKGKEARMQVSPSGAENNKNHAVATKIKESKEQNGESFKTWRSTSKEKEARMELSPSGGENYKNHAIATKMVDCGCAPLATCTKFARGTGNRRIDWGRNFELKFGNKTAISGSRGDDDNNATKHQNRASVDLITVTVSSIHDLIAFDPETTIVEFDSNVEGKELGRLYRIAKVLNFKRFVRSYTLVRAKLHYICSSFDGERHGRDLDAEAKEVLCSNKDKKK